MIQTPDFDRLAAARYVSLTTYRRDGRPVPTPVWIAPDQTEPVLYVLTMVGAGKLKRLRHTPAVEVAPCNYKGVVRGPAVSGAARILPPEEHARAERALTRKYWLQKRLLYLYHALAGGRQTYLEIRLEDARVRLPADAAAS